MSGLVGREFRLGLSALLVVPEAPSEPSPKIVEVSPVASLSPL